MTQPAEAPATAPAEEAPPAVAPATEPAPTEPAPPETPEQIAAKEVETRRAARIERATAAERAAAEARESARARREYKRVEVERQRLAQERQAYEAKQREEAEAIRAGGLKALRARGLDYKDLTKEWIDQSTPEGQERARVQKQLEDQQAKIAELTQAQQSQQIERAYQQIEGTLEQRATEFPYAYELSPGMFRAGVAAIAQQLARQGRQPTESLVLKTLDEAQKSEHDVREARKAALQKRSVSTASNATTQQPGSPNASRAVRTLTSQDGSTRAADGAGRRKTDAELNEEIARTIRPMLRTE